MFKHIPGENTVNLLTKKREKLRICLDSRIFLIEFVQVFVTEIHEDPVGGDKGTFGQGRGMVSDVKDPKVLINTSRILR